MQYIGQTTRELHDRMNEHRSKYKTKSGTGVAKHQCYREHNFEDFNVMVIEVHVNKPQSAAPPTLLNNSEKRWIAELETMQPHGMNVA